MGRLQIAPKHRITIQEMKHEQQIRFDKIRELYNFFAPGTASGDMARGILANDFTSGNDPAMYLPYSISGEDTTNNVTISFRKGYFRGVQNTAGITTHSELASEHEEITPGSGLKNITFNWAASLINADVDQDTSGWINIYIVPYYLQLMNVIENLKYMDSVETNTSQNFVIDHDEKVIAPYIQTAPISINDFSAFFIKTYKDSIIRGGPEIPDAISNICDCKLLNIHGTSAADVQYKDLAVWIGAVLFTPTSYTSASYDKVGYKPFIGTEMVAYDPEEAGESNFNTLGGTLQTAFDSVQILMSGQATRHAAADGDAVNYTNIILVTTDDGDLTSDGYTENTIFPSGYGKRWEK